MAMLDIISAILESECCKEILAVRKIKQISLDRWTLKLLSGEQINNIHPPDHYL
jgi:hypothetical protein